MSDQEKYQEAFRRNINAINGLLSYQSALLEIFNRVELDIIRNAFSITVNDMQALGRDEKIEVSPQEVQKVQRAIAVLKNAILEKPVSQILKDLMNEFGLLVFNWSNNTIKDAAMSREIAYLKRIVAVKTTLDESIRLNKRLLDRVERMAKFMPPSFELARHYLKMLQTKGP